MSKPTDFAYCMTRYLTDYLPGTIGASQNTISSYSDTFRLLLIFASGTRNLKPEKITLGTFSRELVLDFLDWIEEERGCSVQTRNQRLAACHAFFKYVQIQEPKHILMCQEILDIRKKKAQQESANFLSPKGIKLLLSQPSPKTSSGRKHQALLTFMYATACRVQEAVDVTVLDFKFNGNNLVRLTGKGNKSRLLPLEPQVLDMVEMYLQGRKKAKPYSTDDPLFINHSGGKLTRQGVTSILKKYSCAAREEQKDLIPERFSPHCLRHSRAVHWLQAGVDLIYIRDMLGHVSVVTTEVYARIDGEMKRKALERASPENYPDTLPVWQSDPSLLEWLKSF